LKHAVHLKPSFKWALNKQAGEAYTLGKDPGVMGFEKPVVGRCSAQPCGPLVDLPAVIISKLDVGRVAQTPLGAKVDASVLAGILLVTVEPSVLPVEKHCPP